MATKPKPITTGAELDAAFKAKKAAAKKDRAHGIATIEHALKSTEAAVLAAGKELKAKLDAGQLSDEVLTGLAAGAISAHDFKSGKWTRAKTVAGYPAKRKRIEEVEAPEFARLQNSLGQVFEADGLDGVFRFLRGFMHEVERSLFSTLSNEELGSAVKSQVLQSASVAQGKFDTYKKGVRFIAGLNALSAELNSKKAPAKKAVKK
jgi:D-serine deaminase-like pyridoxal phosphate-dependent protein